MLSLPFHRLQGQGCALQLCVQLLRGSTRAGHWGGSPSTRGGSPSSWGPGELGRALPEPGLLHQKRLCLVVPGSTPGMGMARVRGLQLPATDPAWRHRPLALDQGVTWWSPGPWLLHSTGAAQGSPPGTRLAEPMEFSFALKMRVHDFTHETLVRQ